MQVTTAPGQTAAGMISVTIGGGNAYSSACDGYTGYVGLTALGGSASGQLAAVALTGGSATGTNAGLTIAPFGYASGGAVNIGCTAATGINVQWCSFFQTNVAPILQGGLVIAYRVQGLPVEYCNSDDDVGNPYYDGVLEWVCISPAPGIFMWLPIGA